MPRLSKIGAAALGAFGWTSGVSAVTASYIVVAGGGSGGANGSGGGGAGGMLTGTTSLNPTLSYTITVGAGGASAGAGSASNGNPGSNSVFNSITTIGGGYGGQYDNVGGGGGSGGGGGGNPPAYAGGAGTSGQGSTGGSGASGTYNNGGGGGGRGAVGSNATSGAGGAGGVGLTSSISGTSTYYAGGGGGAGDSRGTSNGAGGLGGGGGAGSSSAGTAGTANTGGGGGGGGFSTNISGAGGSGVVIISYLGAQQFGGGVVTSSGGYTIHTFNTSGTLSPLSSLSASYLVVAGGGGAGGSGGGGGAGGYRTSAGTSGGGASAESTLTIDTNSIYLVTVGAGGAPGATTGVSGTNGTDSTFLNITSIGGGYGSGNTAPTAAIGGTGGSGGASHRSAANGGVAGAGTANQGFAGGLGGDGVSVYTSGGGGGGAGAVGATTNNTTGAAGGNGVASSITGTSVTRAGGGGGGTNSSGALGGSGGSGGGGKGSDQSTYNATAGDPNTGGGGGGAQGNVDGTAKAGGSGIVIISYAGATQSMAGGTVTISGGNVIHTFTSSGYLTPLKLVNNSLRFRSSASAYLNRTPPTAGNLQKWTWSAWVKRGALSYGEATLFNAGTTGIGTNDTGFLGIRFTSGDKLDITTGLTDLRLTTQVFRDPAAWYHIVVAVDTTQATGANRVKVYVNGTQVTAFTNSNDPTQNLNTAVNNTYLHEIARTSWNSAGYFDGYQTEVNLIDGQALTPNSFGTFNSYGVWQPITYGGSYGTNGFYLPFTNKTSTTTLGYDFSPAGNNWTTNNISLTTGSTYDSMTDVPTLTSATVANYCTLNPLNLYTGTSCANGNLQGTTVTGAECGIYGTMAMTSGKFYWESTPSSISSGGCMIGIAPATTQGSSGSPGLAVTTGYGYYTTGNKYGGSGGVAYGNTFTTSDVIGCALDLTNGKIWWSKNGVWQASGDPAAGTNAAFTSVSGTFVPGIGNGGAGSFSTVNVNFGQQPFTYTAPSGFLALNTYNI